MKKIIIASVILFLISGCASIVSTSTYTINVQSIPSQATLVVYNKKGETVYEGTTPARFNVQSGSGYFQAGTYILEFSKDGYEPKNYTLKATINGWYFGNLLLGGLIGMLIVDPITGAMWTFPQTEVQTMLETKSSKTDDHSLHIYSILEIPENMKSKMIRVN